MVYSLSSSGLQFMNDSVVYTKNTNLTLEGFDSAAYFEVDKPKKGSEKWKTEIQNGLVQS